MEIRLYEAEMAPALADAWNRWVEGIPHCYPVRPEDITEAMAGVLDPGKGPKDLEAERAIVAWEGGTVLGLAHPAVACPEDAEKPKTGAMRSLWYERGRRAVGQALLEAAEQHVQACGMTRATAWRVNSPYRFYHVMYAHLSDRADHVNALLRMNGYEPVDGEVILDWPDYVPPEPVPTDVEAEVSLEWVDGRGARPGLTVRALQGDEQIGICMSVSGGDRSDSEAAQDWFYTKWLNIAEPSQGKGLGRYLLQRALQELHAAGYRHASISTDWMNARAYLFYSNHGYRQTDWTLAFGRDLT